MKARKGLARPMENIRNITKKNLTQVKTMVFAVSNLTM
jgi:hypothetical protein